jgi:hypothetical protein
MFVGSLRLPASSSSDEDDEELSENLIRVDDTAGFSLSREIKKILTGKP